MTKGRGAAFLLECRLEPVLSFPRLKAGLQHRPLSSLRHWRALVGHSSFLLVSAGAAGPATTAGATAGRGGQGERRDNDGEEELAHGSSFLGASVAAVVAVRAPS